MHPGFRPWDQHLGLLWARVLRQQEIRLDSRVVELGPGFSAKIGHGLAEVGFRGVVVLIEPNDEARRSAAGKYRRLLPQAHVRTQPGLLRHTGKPVQGRVDLLANHVLDDLAALRLLTRRLEHDLSRPVCLRQLGDRDMYWLVSVDPDVKTHQRVRS
jgi:hypothetical protein